MCCCYFQRPLDLFLTADLGEIRSRLHLDAVQCPLLDLVTVRTGRDLTIAPQKGYYLHQAATAARLDAWYQ
jgi:hypothetical protein